MQRRDDAGDALARSLERGALLALLLGADHFDNLTPARDKFREMAGFRVRQRPDLGLGGLGEVSDDGGIDRIGLGALADGLGEGAYLGGIDDDEGEAGAGKAGSGDLLESAGGFYGDDGRAEREELLAKGCEAGAIARDGEHFSARTHGDIQAVLGDIDTDDDIFHSDPSLPNRARSAAPATVRVRWTNGRGAMLSHGLAGPRGYRAPARCRAGDLSTQRGFQVTRG